LGKNERLVLENRHLEGLTLEKKQRRKLRLAPEKESDKSKLMLG